MFYCLHPCQYTQESSNEKAEVGWSFRVDFRTSLNYQQPNSDTPEVIPATGTQGFVHLLTVFPNHMMAELLVHIQWLSSWDSGVVETRQLILSMWWWERDRETGKEILLYKGRDGDISEKTVYITLVEKLIWVFRYSFSTWAQEKEIKLHKI